jgi:signal peptidase I
MTAPKRLGLCLALGILLIGAVSMLRARYGVTIVQGDSMRPTFRTGDLLLVDKWAYRRAVPRRGDIVTACYHRDLVVKRVIGLPGEEVEIRLGALYVDGAWMAEPYHPSEGMLSIDPGRLFAGRFATLGDNRSQPLAVSVHPILSRQDLVGRVIGSCRLPRLH